MNNLYIEKPFARVEQVRFESNTKGELAAYKSTQEHLSLQIRAAPKPGARIARYAIVELTAHDAKQLRDYLDAFIAEQKEKGLA